MYAMADVDPKKAEYEEWLVRLESPVITKDLIFLKCLTRLLKGFSLQFQKNAMVSSFLKL